MGMTLTKEFVNSYRKVGVLRDFLCQAIDQVDEKNNEIAELKQNRPAKMGKRRTIEYEGSWITDDFYYPKSEADKVIADLEESHKMEVEQLLMEIVGLKKLVETADKLLKQKGGFMIKDITFDCVKLEGFKKEVTNAVDKSNA